MAFLPSCLCRRPPTAVGAAASLLVLALALPALAQQPAPPLKGTEFSVPGISTTITPLEPKAAPAAAPPPAESGTTVIPRTPNESKPAPGAGQAQVRLVALLTADGQRIDQGLIWRVYEAPSDRDGKSRLMSTLREPSPTLKLQPGDYFVNAAYGRANLTRKITVAAAASTTEQFVLNAGGLRLSALVGSTPAPANAVSYNIYSDERDQFGNRAPVMTGARPGVIIRLNAGIYQIVSTYGDANASVRADITVEAGKLTEVTVAHSAAKVTLKLVTRTGGEALPDTHWTVQTPQGEVVKESVGALPTHILAPGSYTVIAKSGGRTFRRDFTIQHGDVAQIEVMMQ